MIAVLEDKKTLSIDPAAQAAAIKLKEILNDELIITTNEEASAIQTALDAIKVAKEQSEESIRKLAEEKQNALKASEENIKEITEENRNALHQRASESAKEINTVKEQAIENVSTTVSKVVKETYEPQLKRLKLGQDDQEKRLRTIEAEQQSLQRKQLELEKQVDKVEKHVTKLNIIEEEHQTRLGYLKQKQGLQKYLVDVYQQHYVRTSISPLLTQQNDVNIRDVYVSPRMEVEENKDGNDGSTTEDRKDWEGNHKRVERYRDLFSSREKLNRRIFILGDVGTGKSSFCKMMIQNWCTAITKRGYTYNSGVTEEEDAKQSEESNTCDMNQFDFLFYIPLREMSGRIDDTVDMIKAQLEDYKVLINDIFTNDSERILILADGLDEWTPSSTNRPPSLHPVTPGIPNSRSTRASTIVTTSRPSSRGILNIKSSEYDLKVSLLGLNHTSVQPMIEKYTKLLNKTSAVSDFKGKLANLKLKDIQNAPLLLQQMIWLYCNNYEIGQSRSFIYLNIVNIVLGWEHERMECDTKLHEFQNRDLEHLPLPKSFDKFVRCQENRTLLLLLGRLAYDAYITGSDSSLVFGRYKLKQLGVSQDGISAILRTGILTEVNSTDPTYEKSRFSFIHTSYLEFFAALYICSSYLSKITDANSSGTPLTIFEGFIAITTKTSVAELLRLENVLIMTCGLVPCLTEHVCECIYKISMGLNIDCFLCFTLEKMEDKFVVRQIEKLMFDCLSEHYSVDQKNAVKFKQRRLYEPDFSDEVRLNMYLYGLDATAIEACHIGTLLALSEENYSLSHKQYTLSHEQFSLLSSCLSQAVSFHTLEINNIKCTKDKCQGHIIDLSNHRQLQSIVVSNSQISVCGINHTSPVSCRISDCKLSHNHCSFLSSYLSQAVSIQTLYIESVKCTKDECEGHNIDLTNHRQLQSIDVSNSQISVCGINHTCPVSCSISDCELSHNHCSLLSSYLSQATSLQLLHLSRIECTKPNCEGRCNDYHEVDLTNHSQLKELSISHCNMIYISGINSTCPVSKCNISNCNLSHEQCAALCTFLSHATSLGNLTLREIKCTEDACEGHTIDLINYNQLGQLSISNCNMISINVINTTCPVWKCNISNRILSHEQCAALCTFLSHATSSGYLTLRDIKCTEDTCEGHDIDLTNHNQLRQLSISNCNMISVIGMNPTCPVWQCNISNCNLSHEQCAALCTFLSHATSSGYLTLRDIRCTEDACEAHNIDLTYHNLLRELSISNCNMISITGINPTCRVWKCYISNCNLSHEQCAALCTFLSHATSLKYLTLREIKCTDDACEGHDIDLTKHNQLRELSISNCNMVSVIGITPTCPVWKCNISNRILSHEQCLSLCTFLSQATSLGYLTLRDIKCTEDACEGHDIDLTSHNQLRELSLSNCNMIYINGMNPTCPVWQCNISNCNLSHEQCAALCTFLSHAKSLECLTLREIKCTDDTCEGHDIDLTNHNQLWGLSLSNCNMISMIVD